jgi:DNA-binding MarR family transcriptional regulator
MRMKSPYAKTVGYELLHAARLHRARSAELLVELGLFPGQEQVLTLLASEGRTMGELAATLRVRPPTASKTIARLAAQGLVERRAGAGDARQVRVELTEEGRRRAAAVGAVWAQLEREAVRELPPKERKQLRKLLRIVGRNVAVRLRGDISPREPEGEAEP